MGGRLLSYCVDFMTKKPDTSFFNSIFSGFSMFVIQNIAIINPRAKLSIIQSLNKYCSFFNPALK